MTQFNTRRKFLIAAAALSGAAGLGLYGHQTSQTRNQLTKGELTIDANPILRSIVDTIIPEDQSPGALSLQIDTQLQQKMLKKPTLNAQVERLLKSVSKASLTTHRQAFETLTIDQRETLLLSMLERDAPQRARFDMQAIRQNVMALFYTSEQGQASINYLAPKHYPAYARVT